MLISGRRCSTPSSYIFYRLHGILQIHDDMMMNEEAEIDADRFKL